ncbi:MAG: DUF362 domain-containing protein [Bacteroidota bacterium]|nr:DUF362 domain-containing protein [Bacteroidota bacterium]
MDQIDHEYSTPRRDFLKRTAGGFLAATIIPLQRRLRPFSSSFPDDKPATNIRDALKYPRTERSLPGRYPARVIQSSRDDCMTAGKPDAAKVDAMLQACMLALTGERTLSAAWGVFVEPDDLVGLKVNPVAGKELSTSLELTRAVIRQLEVAGIPRERIVIWDRREFELKETGFTAENFPGIRIVGTEWKNEKDSFFDEDGLPLGRQRIDENWYYWADCEEKYDNETLPYMVNEGKYSYFSSIVTKEMTKIINIPILKNAGPTVTLCLKNLAYGSITNTGRLHRQLWAETCAQVPCFPPLRDKVVLNIVDGIVGCYEGGPGANPQFIVPFNTLLVGTDPVAVDRIGYDIVLRKRLEMKVQKKESPRGTAFLALAETYNIGIGDPEKIDLRKV